MTLGMDLSVRIERWPLAGTFTISRGSKSEAVVVEGRTQRRNSLWPRRMRPLPTLQRKPGPDCGGHRGHAPGVAPGSRPRGAPGRNAPGAARNALDCAYWDVNAKQSGRRVCEFAGLVAPEPRVTASTISLAASAQRARFVDLDRPLLLAKDRAGGLRYDGSLIYPPESALWG